MAYTLKRPHKSAYRRRQACRFDDCKRSPRASQLREPYTDADAHAALRMVTQNSLPMQRYCNRATTSCKVYATVASLDNEVLDGSTKAQSTKSEQPARGTAIERFAIAPTARRSAAAVHQEANNGATDTDSRAQHTIERTSSKLLSLQKRRKRIKIACVTEQCV